MRRTDAVPAQRVFAGCAVPVFILPQFICVISADNFEPEHFEQKSARRYHPIAVESLFVFLSGLSPSAINISLTSLFSGSLALTTLLSKFAKLLFRR